ncbi:MAG: DUF4162 domain-containing protein [Microthrixaceae bacterium]
MEEADQLCDRVAIIDRGEIVALDTPGRLKASVGADTIVRVSTEDDPEALAAALSRRVGSVTDAAVHDGVVVLATTSANGVLPQIVQCAQAEGFSVTDLSLRETTLEDVFIALTGRDLRE